MNTIHYLKNIINARIIVNSMLIELHTKLNTIGTVIQFPSYSNLDLRDAKVNIILDIVKEHVIFESSLELYHELHPTIVLEDYLRDSLANQPKEVPSMKAIVLKAIHILKLEAAGSLKDSDYCEDPIKCFDILPLANTIYLYYLLIMNFFIL